MKLTKLKELIPAPEDGKEGLTVSVGGESITASKSTVVQTFRIPVEICRGGEVLRYGDYGCSTLAVGDIIDGILLWEFEVVDGIFNYVLYLNKDSVANVTIPYKISVGDVTLQRYIYFTTKEDGKDGKDGKDGADAMTYKLEITPSVVTYNPNTSSYDASAFALTVRILKNGEVTEITDASDLEPLGIDVIYYNEYGSHDYISNLGGEMSWSRSKFLTWGREFRLVDYNDDSAVYDTAKLTVVNHGKAGQNGQAGERGKFYYYAGIYEPKEYTSSDYQAPYVGVEWQETVTQNGAAVSVTRTSFYMLVAKSNIVNGTFAAPRTSAASGVWEIMETSFKYLISEMIFSSFAKMGSAVFCGDWMISQHGRPGRALGETSREMIAALDSMGYSLGTIGTWDIVTPPEMAYDKVLALYSDENISAMIDDAQWAVTNNLTADQLLALSNTSYEYFGHRSDDMFAVWSPNLAIDLLTGKVISYNMEIRGVITAPVIYHSFKKLSLQRYEGHTASLEDEIFKIYLLATHLIAGGSFVDSLNPIIFIPLPQNCTGKVYEFVAGGSVQTSGSAGFYVRTIGYDYASADSHPEMFSSYVACLDDGKKVNGYLRIVSDGEVWIPTSS